jgi:hypothetical protein
MAIVGGFDIHRRQVTLRSARLGGAGARALETDECAQRPGHAGGSLIAMGVPGLSKCDSPRTSTFSGSPLSTR